MGTAFSFGVLLFCIWKFTTSLANPESTAVVSQRNNDDSVDAQFSSSDKFTQATDARISGEENARIISQAPTLEYSGGPTASEKVIRTSSNNNGGEDSTSPPFPSESSSFWEPEIDEAPREYDDDDTHQTDDISGTKLDSVDEQERTTKSNTGRVEAGRPNIILIITDDQDVELGSMEYMPETLKVFRAGGVEFRHGYVSTPICCPSRSSLLTGMYVHNHEVFTNNDNCSSISWREKFEKKTFASHLWLSGYYTSYIGKYLNKYDGSHIPHGWDEWNGLLMNSRYYNYTLNRNGKRFRYGYDLDHDYYPDSIARDSLDFLDRVASDSGKQPFLLVLSFPSPHGPEDSAPKYSNLFLNATPHHTPSYNFAPNPDKQWILRITDKMTPMLKDFTNVLMTKRLQTLQSVDTAVGDIFRKLDATSLRDTTYAFYTSDHGYHVGNFGLVKGKSMPYEFDIRVPFFLAGPKAMVRGGTMIREPVLNIDFAPTFLDMANLPIPEEMDGRSMFPLIKKYCPDCEKEDTLEWPDVFLIESPGRRNAPSNSGGGGTGSGEHVDKHSKKIHRRKNKKTIFDEDEILSLTNLCALHPHPCLPGQKKYCRKEKNRIRFRKCRHNVDFLISSRFLSSDPRINDPAYGHNISLTELSNQKCSCRLRRSATYDYLEDESGIDWETERKKIDDEIEKLKQRIEYLRHRRKEMRRKWLAENLPLAGVDDDSLTEHSQREERKHKGLGNVSDSDGVDDHDSDREEDYVDSNESDEIEREDKEERGGVVQGHAQDNLEFNVKLDEAAVSTLDRTPLGRAVNERVQNETEDSSLDGDLASTRNSGSTNDDDLRQDQFSEGSIALPAETSSRDKTIQRGRNKQHGRSKLKGSYSFHKHQTPIVDGENESCNCYNDPKWLRQKEKEDRKHRKLLSKLRKKQRLFKRIEDPVERQQAETCGKEEKMNCFWHDSDHWRTTPFWTGGSFCFCMNANNNSYSCLRSVNTTHNYLYCQFVTGFKMYFDLKQDPYQLRNAINTLPAESEDWILARLFKLKQCKGKADCWSDDVGNDDPIHPSLWEQIFGRPPKKRRKGGRRRKYQGT